ncbi:CgeB family protein [Listeria kieliensis]|uniref:Spore protein YkvP/CgeB glycosyl transferase-like domain-containing protein n=1 Tax=Listeria kieliensis TaxID=1621700 RepID=A0A3D8TME6_9LIST|nr:glycosyltransferase [Listeria kieliensis]RDW99438.1 hypothetical protein UR08_11425 [Listeria kieliensis]
MSKRTVLCVGATFPGANSQSFFDGFRSLDFQVITISTDYYFYHYTPAERVYMRIMNKPYSRKYQQFNERIMDALKKTKPDLFFVVKGLWVDKETIIYAKKLGAKTIHFHPDFLFDDRYHTSKVLNKAITEYDIVVTPKITEVTKYKKYGCTNVVQTQYAYDPSIHHPTGMTEFERSYYGSMLTFVGRMEAKRSEWLEEIAKRGYDLKVWGTNWNKLPKDNQLRRFCTYEGVYMQNMAKVFEASNISLGFLTHLSNEQHTARTFEIPACGGFLLAERTDEHKALFVEGEEADFFSDSEEMHAKIDFYSDRLDVVGRMKQKGYERVKKLSATYKQRVIEILTFLDHY